MFALFRFDLPTAVTEQLVEQLDQMKTIPLTEAELKRLADYQAELAKIQKLPRISQGVYVIYFGDKAVYAGKAENLRSRLGDHKFKLSGRHNIDATKMGFKCLLLEGSWSISANETLLIDHFKAKGECEWNLNGFGINDPGKNRDGAIPNSFDTKFPINEDLLVENLDNEETAKDVLSKLKEQLPFLLRFALDDVNAGKRIKLKSTPKTAKSVLLKVAETLGPEWQLMLFKGYVTLYKDNRRYENGIRLYP